MMARKQLSMVGFVAVAFYLCCFQLSVFTTEAFTISKTSLTTRTNGISKTSSEAPSFSVVETRLQASSNTDETTKKYGLEAGLFQSLKQKDGGESAKSLLKKYGIAYLATSIPLALVSFALCYVLVDNGIDVSGLLAKIGIETNAAVGDGSVDVASKAGTFAIAYAAHKAASPIRFPPTVLLTPVVAKLIGKEPVADDDGEEQSA